MVSRVWRESSYQNTLDGLRRPRGATQPSGVTAPRVAFGSPLPAASAFQVKQIMEEAVTRKFVHEDSSHIISFCGESMPHVALKVASFFVGCLGGVASW